MHAAQHPRPVDARRARAMGGGVSPLRTWSYIFLFSGSDSASYAAAICVNFCSDFSLAPGLRSGCHFLGTAAEEAHAVSPAHGRLMNPHVRHPPHGSPLCGCSACKHGLELEGRGVRDNGRGAQCLLLVSSLNRPLVGIGCYTQRVVILGLSDAQHTDACTGTEQCKQHTQKQSPHRKSLGSL